MKKSDNFNFVIGRYWDSKKREEIGAYALMSSEVHYGNLEEATKLCNEISKREKKKYGIFQLIDVKELQILQDDLKLANETIKIQHRLMKNAEKRGEDKAIEAMKLPEFSCFMCQKTQPNPKWLLSVDGKRTFCSKYCYFHYCNGSDLT